MTRNVTLQLDEFGQESLDRLVTRRKAAPTTAFRTAALYYLADKDAERVSWRAPRPRPTSGSSAGLRVAFDDETWNSLGEEAARQGVSPEELAVHALLYFLADLESGRLAGMIKEALVT